MSSLYAVHTLHGQKHTASATATATESPYARFSGASIYRWLHETSINLWLITKDDFLTFVVPNTVFGVSGALASSTLIEHSSTQLEVVQRIPLVVFFNWSNVLIFELANQKSPESAKEDALNKPWRAIPSGRLTSGDLRKAMLFLIPAVLAFHHFVMHLGTECALLIIMTWLYNDLGGGEDWKLRETIIATAFGVYNVGSLKTAAGYFNHTLAMKSAGWKWAFIVSCIIFTTMSVQDLKDQEGDRARNRRTVPIAVGDTEARWFIASSILFWSCICFWFWDFKLVGFAGVALGAIVSWRCIAVRGKRSDYLTWVLWAFWLAVLYIFPSW
jgi:4-hydroxybenzoate polyprenyltransferase